MTLLQALLSKLTKPRIEVNTYHVKKTDLQAKRDEMCRQLAKECGMEGKW